MSYFEGVDMKRVEPELKVGETEIISVFHDEIIFRAKEYQRFCWLGNNEQVLKNERAVRVLMLYKFVCTCHGKMVDTDTGKPCRVIMKYGNNYNGYWTGEDVTIHTQDTHKTFTKTQPGCLPLYIFDNSENQHKISKDDLNERKPNLKDGGKNTPLLSDGYCKRPDGSVVVHAMQNKADVQKGLCTMINE